MKKLVLTFLLILSASAAKAQTSVDNRLELDEWHDGQVTLRTGEVFEGSINYNYLMDLIWLKTEDLERVFNGQQILEFWVSKQDEEAEEEKRVFYKSLNLRTGNQIYEVVAEDDEKALLVATIRDTKTVAYPAFIGFSTTPYGVETHTVHRKAESFFIVTNEGTVYELGRIVIKRNIRGQLKSTINEKKLAQVLKQFKPDIEEYLEANNINLKKRPQLIDTFKSVLNER